MSRLILVMHTINVHGHVQLLTFKDRYEMLHKTHKRLGRLILFLNGPNPASFLFIFVLFSHCMDKYSTNLTINEKSVDDMLGSRTRGGRMEGAEESTV